MKDTTAVLFINCHGDAEVGHARHLLSFLGGRLSSCHLPRFASCPAVLFLALTSSQNEVRIDWARLIRGAHIPDVWEVEQILLFLINWSPGCRSQKPRDHSSPAIWPAANKLRKPLFFFFPPKRLKGGRRRSLATPAPPRALRSSFWVPRRTVLTSLQVSDQYDFTLNYAGSYCGTLRVGALRSCTIWNWNNYWKSKRCRTCCHDITRVGKRTSVDLILDNIQALF